MCKMMVCLDNVKVHIWKINYASLLILHLLENRLCDLAFLCGRDWGIWTIWDEGKKQEEEKGSKNSQTRRKE
jgi:hypothetical protein